MEINESMEEKKNVLINLNLTFNDVNMIIAALSDKSFKDVYALIGKIHTQSSSQLANKNNTEVDNT